MLSVLQVGLLRYENPAQPETLDEDGNVVTEAVEASGAHCAVGGQYSDAHGRTRNYASGARR